MKNLPKILLMIVLWLGWQCPARAQVFEWARIIRGQTDTTSALAPRAVTSTTDAEGNTYAIVSMHGSVRAGAISLTNSQRANAIVKYSPSGEVLWAKRLLNTTIIALAADKKAGGVFVLGETTGAGSWDGAPLPEHAFYAKCTAQGSLQWAKFLPGTHPNPPAGQQYNRYLTADDAGNAYVSGLAALNITLGLVPVPASQIYVFKINGAGTMQWVRTLHTNSTTTDTYYRSLELGVLGAKPGGGCVVSGYLFNRMSVPSINLFMGAGNGVPLVANSTAGGPFIINLDAAGTPIWSKLAGEILPGASANNFKIASIAADAAGNCYLSGTSRKESQSAAPGDGTFYLVKLTASGVHEWLRTPQPGAGATAAIRGENLVATSRGVSLLVINLNRTELPHPILGVFPLRALINLVHYSSQGQEQWAVSGDGLHPPTGTSIFLGGQQLSGDAQGNLFLFGTLHYLIKDKNPVAQIGAQTVEGHGPIVARLSIAANTLRGNVYLDQNSNGQREANEVMFSQPLTAVLTQGATTTLSAVNTDGTLQVFAQPGPYTLSLGQLPPHHTVTQPGAGGTYTGSFSRPGQHLDGQDFGIKPTPNQTDLRLTLTSFGVARPGGQLRYRLTLENVGTTTTPAGVATLNLDTRAQLIGAPPAGTVVGQTVMLPYPVLLPFERTERDVSFSLATDVKAGDILKSSASSPLADDVVPADNTSNLTQTVRSSFDPNDIEVNYQRLSPTQLAEGLPLDYTIRFQNMGTDTAFTVVLKDTLDGRLLNLKTLQLVAQSHNCTWSLAGKGLFTVRFLNIRLPQKSINEAQSQGFVRFRVQPYASLKVGTVIRNQASIVFDYNEPVHTNQATTAVLATDMAVSQNSLGWSVFPNPTTGQLTLMAGVVEAGIIQVDLLDVVGRSIRHSSFATAAGTLYQTLSLQDVEPGIYLLRLQLPNSSVTSQRVVKW